MQCNPPIGQAPDIGDVDGEAAAELAAAGWGGERGEGVVGRAGVGDGSLIDSRPERSFNTVRFLEDWSIAYDPPDQQAFGGQALIEALAAAILEEQILAAVGFDQHLDTILGRLFDR